MYDVAVCIPTYKRPLMLERLLQSITDCRIDKSLIGGISIIVVDNDADRTGENTVTAFSLRLPDTYRIQYYNFPVKGLANVRNELLVRSLALNPEFIVFIDDDEYVTENWLNELILTVVNNNGDAARGPVIAKPTAPVPPGIAMLLKRENYPNNSPIGTWTAGNLIMRTSSLRKFNVKFDERFNKCGAEDSYFGIQMAQKGASIFWAAQAVVFEAIPEHRIKVQWFIRRYYRGAATFIYMLKLEGNYLLVFKKITVSAFYIFIGCVSSVFLLIPAGIKYWGILKVSEGIGGFAGLFNIRYKEYK